MRNAFTMIELIFVTVVLGIIGSVGANVLSVMYENYISSAINNQMQAQTELALQQISNRLSSRIKDSVIAANDDTNGSGQYYFDSLSSSRDDVNYTRIEWASYDEVSWLGDDTNTSPAWTGFIDVDVATPNISRLISPGTDLRTNGRVDMTIKARSDSTIDDAAIFFVGANTNADNGYGWNGTLSNATYPITAATNIGEIIPSGYTFSGMDVFEQYKLAWTAYAIGIDVNNGNLYLYYDYQPWLGEDYDDNTTKQALLLEHVSTIKAQAIGDVIKLQLCVDNNISGLTSADELYSICKEKVIF